LQFMPPEKQTHWLSVKSSPTHKLFVSWIWLHPQAFCFMNLAPPTIFVFMNLAPPTSFVLWIWLPMTLHPRPKPTKVQHKLERLWALWTLELSKKPNSSVELRLFQGWSLLSLLPFLPIKPKIGDFTMTWLFC
jgi:hypothetical protein